MVTRLAVVALCLGMSGCGFKARKALEITGEEAAAERLAPGLEGVGTSEFNITTESAAAQTFFNQGVSLIHGFWYYEALRAFEEAARLDSASAMPYWGQYQAMQRLGKSRKVRRQALQRARELMERASGREAILFWPMYCAIRWVGAKGGGPI